jgi:hypothetical protein
VKRCKGNEENMSSAFRISGVQTIPISGSDIRIIYINTCKIIAAANNANGAQVIIMRSNVGGVAGSWNQATLPLHVPDVLQRDPTVDWTSDETAWAIIVGSSTESASDPSATLQLRCFKSNDGGASWQYDDTVSGNQTKADKPMMLVEHNKFEFRDALDPPREYFDYICVIWHNYPTGMPNDPPGVFVNYRTPGPSGAWGTPVKVSSVETTGQGHGCDIKSGHGTYTGVILAFWHDTGSKNVYVSVGYDGGAAFEPPVVIDTTLASNDIAIPSSLSTKPVITHYKY